MIFSKWFYVGYVLSILGLVCLMAVGVASEDWLTLLAVPGLAFLLAFLMAYKTYLYNKKVIAYRDEEKKRNARRCVDCAHYKALTNGFGKCTLTRDKGVPEDWVCDDWETKLD